MACIAVVDDNPASALPLSRLLQYSGHEVEVYLRIGEAMDALRSHSPDLVMLDVGMPEMDGIEVLQLIRKDEQLRELPVVMYSAMSDPKVQEEATRLGALEYLVKGGGWEELLHRIESHLTPPAPKH